MAITAALCNSYKQESLQGIHASGDTYKIALYPSSATLSKATTVYSSIGECANGNGYTTGGATLTGFAVTLSTDTAVLDFSDPTWPNSTITARGALIYNSSKGNKAVCVLDFGADIVSTAGPFVVTFPAVAADTGLIRF